MKKMVSSQSGSNDPNDLPQVLVLNSPPVLTMFEYRFSEKFHILKASDSHLSLDQFLVSHAVQSAKAILCRSGGSPRISSDIIRQLPSLRLIVTTSAGVDHIDVADCRRRGIEIANAGDVFSDDVADMAVGLLIDVLRKISSRDRYVRRGHWAMLGDFHLGSKLRGKRVGIVGLGRIGRQSIKKARGFWLQNLIQLKEEIGLCPLSFLHRSPRTRGGQRCPRHLLRSDRPNTAPDRQKGLVSSGKGGSDSECWTWGNCK